MVKIKRFGVIKTASFLGIFGVQLEEYQRKDFVRINGEFTVTADDYIACSHID